MCYGVRYHPSRISDECEHTFCRLCVFKMRTTGPMHPAACPLCRAPQSEGLDEALMPSEIAYDEAQATGLLRAHPGLYHCALKKEADLEDRLRETLIPRVPLVMLPGSCAQEGGLPIRPKVRSTMTFLFSEPDALKTLSAHKRGQVGVVFREASIHGGAMRGFLARPLRCNPVRKGSTSLPTPYLAKLAPLQEFELVGSMHRDADGCMVGAVEVKAASPRLPMVSL